jgi:hypothetical protein
MTDLVHAVVGGATVEQVAAARPAEQAAHGVAHEIGHQRQYAIGHGRIHYLTLARAFGLPQCGQHTHEQVQAAAAVVAHEVEWRHRRAVLRTDRIQRAADGDVVEVVARGLCERTLLSPAGHAAVDDAGVARQHRIGPEAQALHHAWPVALDEHVGALQQAPDPLVFGGILQVGLHHRAAAAGEVVALAEPPSGTVDGHDVGAHVRQEHAGKRAGADAGEFDDAQAGERTTGVGGGCHG